MTAPGSSAEAIPFLKTWVNLPGAIGFTVLYSAMANRLGRQALFYSVLGPFLAFFGAFPLIYQLRGALHPVGLATWLAARLPAGFAAPIAVLRNWTYSLFYLLANMWGSVVVSLLFWGTANDVVTVPEAKKCAAPAPHHRLPDQGPRPPPSPHPPSPPRAPPAGTSRSSASSPTSRSSSQASSSVTSLRSTPLCRRGWTRGASHSSCSCRPWSRWALWWPAATATSTWP